VSAALFRHRILAISVAAVAANLVWACATAAQTFVLVDANGETIPEVAPDAEAPRVSPFPWLTLDLLAATRDRPLFSPQRRGEEPEPEVVEEEPEPEPEPVAPVAEVPPPRVRLSGVVISGALRLAMLHDDETDDIIRLRQGQSFSDWTLVAVEPRSVLFRHGEQEHKVDLAAELETPGEDE
jgi:hypothetical protein